MSLRLEADRVSRDTVLLRFPGQTIALPRLVAKVLFS